MSPRQPRAGHFLGRGLFSHLCRFSELERRISELPTDKDRGDAFEVFTEAYLATQKIVGASDIWPFEAMSETLKRRLLPGASTDQGADGVYETTRGTFCAYQAKFRSGRPTLSWRDLSTFFGLTDRVEERLIFTNSDALPKVLNERTGYFAIRGNDLDRLEERDFLAIEKFLRGQPVQFKRKEPLRHQKEALDDILLALKEHDRATAVMACGTGKTLVGLWAAERLGAACILVLEPSLALLRQTLHEWLRETNWPEVSYLCVCSDPTVQRDSDEIIVRQSETDFPVTTDTATARNWLTRSITGVRIVFSTYQSSSVVAEAINDLPPFDLGVFDEAHKTAGREARKFALALSDENLPICKRLFLTATPRRYNPLQKNKEGDAQLVFSMDQPEVYGQQAHSLSFAKAVRRGIICDYKVIISVVTSEMVNDDRIRRGEVIVDGDPVRARQVATQIALQKSVEEYGASRVFTFHGKVAAAKSFIAEGGEGIRAHLPQFEAYHVNGKMSASVRDGLLWSFAEAKHAIMSNARCLTEGVDVPAVDMVAFMSPKRSKIDIIQATGRAMRKPKDQDKSVGYVLLPIFLELAVGETLEEALERTEYGEIWDVLQALTEHDEVLADIIREIREDKGRTGGYDGSRLGEKVEVLGAELSLTELRQSIATLVVEKLGTTWDEMFGKLIRYREETGDCNVPARWPDDPQLGAWVPNQRIAYRHDKLSSERIQRLEEIGLVWDRNEARWEENFKKLLVYREEKGDCNVPRPWPDDPPLARWVNYQRNAYRHDKLSSERIRRLAEIDFVSDLHSLTTLRAAEARWEENFENLLVYREEKGDCNVPDNWSDDPLLVRWVGEQRRDYMRGKLSAKKIERLKEIGFVWDQREAEWEENFKKLVSYKNDNGDCDVPGAWSDQRLARWVREQRQNYERGELTPEKQQRLDEIGFKFRLR